MDLTPVFWLVAAHLAAAALWIGGMLAVGLTRLALPNGGPPDAVATMRGFSRAVTTPAMLATFAAGLALAVWTGAWAAPWLLAKLLLVLALAALHGAQSADLRRPGDASRASAVLRFAAPIVVAATTVIALVSVMNRS